MRVCVQLVDVCVRNNGLVFARHIDSSFMRGLSKLLKLVGLGASLPAVLTPLPPLLSPSGEAEVVSESCCSFWLRLGADDVQALSFEGRAR